MSDNPTETRWPAPLIAHRDAVGIAGIVAVFTVIYLGALWFLSPVHETGVGTGTGSDDPRLGVGYVLVLLIATVGIIVAFKRGFAWIVRGVMILVAAGISMLVLAAWIPPGPFVAGAPLVPGLAAAALGLALAFHPRWYVLDVAGILMGIGAVAVFGLVLGIRPVLVLLVLLAVYDAIAVYGTKHMVSLADNALRDRLPVMLVIPLPGGRPSLELPEEGEERQAIMIGLGDVVIPGMLVASAAVHGPGDPVTVGGIVMTAPAIGAAAGVIAGLLALFTLFERGRPHPGLPALNAGAIVGYLVGAAAVGVPITGAFGL